MAGKSLPTVETLRQLLDYDPQTGILTWRFREVGFFTDGARTARHAQAVWNAKCAGKEAGKPDIHDGYVKVGILGVRYRAHRIAWAMVNGAPMDQIDHIDGDRSNNRIANLRAVNAKTNARNKRRVNSALGVLGVTPSGQRFRAHIKVDKRQRHLGSFATVEEAKAARDAAARELGFHANHGDRPSLRIIPEP